MTGDHEFQSQGTVFEPVGEGGRIGIWLLSRQGSGECDESQQQKRQGRAHGGDPEKVRLRVQRLSVSERWQETLERGFCSVLSRLTRDRAGGKTADPEIGFPRNGCMVSVTHC